MPQRRVVITGIDALSCLGSDLPGIEASLRTSRSGIVIDAERQRRGFRSPLTGALPVIDWQAALPRRERRGMGEAALYAARCARRAVAMAGLGPAQLRSPRVGLLFGNDAVGEPFPELLNSLRQHRGTGALGSDLVLRSLGSTATLNLAPLLGIQGLSLTVAGACASGAHALGLAWMLVASGLQDLVIAGGTQELCWQGLAAFDGLRVFSTRIDDPTRASRPFGLGRDGLVPSGGAASLVLEDLEHAQARGAEPLAELLGYAFGCDGHHPTSADGKGAERCLRAALDTCGLGPAEVDYLNAHATGTPAGDAAEAEAIHAVFGDRVPVSSTKSLTGHECWMAGASEALYCVLMLRGDFIAPNANWERDPALPPIQVVATVRQDVRLRTVLSSSFGFGGTNAVLVLRAWEGV